MVESCDEKLFSNGTTIDVQYKWGLDGASGQSQYKQIFQSSESTDKSILMISLVPLLIKCGSLVLWKNPRSSSTRFCRPIRFEFIKEDKDTVIAQHKMVQDQINELQLTSIELNGKQLQAEHKLDCTMIDGKTLDYLSDSTHCNCNICGALPSQMNNFVYVKTLPCNVENYSFGLSTLHCWIRFLECLLHISYRLQIKRTDARGAENKAIVEREKRRIQDEFKAKTGTTNLRFAFTATIRCFGFRIIFFLPFTKNEGLF